MPKKDSELDERQETTNRKMVRNRYVLLFRSSVMSFSIAASKKYGCQQCDSHKPIYNIREALINSAASS